MKLIVKKPLSLCKMPRKGFTLMEAIATLMLSAVLVALLLPLIGSQMKGSRNALLGLPETQSLRSVMDELWHTYRTTDPIDLSDFSADIAAAASATPAPDYTLIHNDWVEFDGAGNEYIPADGSQTVLRVTIGNSKGEQLTAYFFRKAIAIEEE